MWESEKLSHKCREPLPEPDTPPLPTAEQLRAAVRTLHLRAGRPAANDIAVANRWVLTAGTVASLLAYTDGHAIGYAYGNRIGHGDRYWQRTSPTPAEEYTSGPAFALKEIGVRPAWRGTGTARRIHDALLATRDEPYVTLMVNPSAGDGKVHELNGSWGYKDIGRSQPSPASPVLTVMIRAN